MEFLIFLFRQKLCCNRCKYAKEKTNSLGYDVFFFQLDSNGKLLPVNDTDTLDECKSTGFSCAKWVLLYGNQAYRKCPEKVEYNRKTKC